MALEVCLRDTFA
ncbi:hypothetical protein FXE34_07590 [Vibrio cholerae]|nr:hypothetical protein FLM03_19790 [Vibrio cholerae]TQQ49462.1 hypothetical protein FLL62_15125 [Vibrio cholerae]TQQ50844.1 hypothetical protein FLL62_13545 [Vibrio cholerae]TQQ56078.1 hypothetical protein FLL63_18355 [Vibrio cholerae]TXX48718.1 hypothetical protein FXF14_10270 [Vibrio cholerae]